jgi:predicted RNase H-like nuclease (RuvC/YqgF family)
MIEFEDKTKESEKRLADLEYQIKEAEARIRNAEARVHEAQVREDDARRAYRRVEDDTAHERKRLEDLKQEAEEKQKQVDELAEWIQKLSDIRQMLILFVKAILGYLKQKESDRSLSVTERQSAGIAKRLIEKLQNDFINVAARAAKRSLEQILRGRHIYDDTQMQQQTAPVQPETKPAASASGGSEKPAWYDDYSPGFFLGASLK